MSGVYCNQCGHLNQPESTFCASCGAVVELRADQTLVLGRIDPLQGASTSDDDIVVNVGDLDAGDVRLILRNGPELGAALAVSEGVTRLGRHPDSEIPLDDITVSRRHAEIRRDGSRFVIADVGSLNGTYLNGLRVDSSELKAGDEVQVGKFRMLFYVRGAA